MLVLINELAVTCTAILLLMYACFSFFVLFFFDSMHKIVLYSLVNR